MDPAELDRILHNLPAFKNPALLVGYSHKDDAAVYRLPTGEALVQTVDFFTPVVDDPYDFGAIAAANSLSDIYAMNGRPLLALNISCFSRKQPPEIWNEVLRGGAEKAIEAGVVIAGGHTVDDPEPKYGLVVTGLIDPERMWTNAGAGPGDALILTKPLGTGLITTALKNEKISVEQAADVIAAMKMLNREAASVLADFSVHSCTDVTGYGLIGHAWEICDTSGVGMELFASQVPLFNAAPRLAESGGFPGGTFANRQYFGPHVDVDPAMSESLSWLLFDAQTSGGLLAVIPSEQSQKAVQRLRAAGVTDSAIVGRVTDTRRIRIVR